MNRTRSLMHWSVVIFLLGSCSFSFAQNSPGRVSAPTCSFLLSMSEVSTTTANLNASCTFGVTAIDTINTIKIGFGRTSSVIDQDAVVYRVIKEQSGYFLVGNSLKLVVLNDKATALIPASMPAHTYKGKYLIVVATDKSGNTSPVQSVLIQ
ncbi:MAG: hypothetical protein JWM14_1280 [Chitinophagaceae bacterium]|nr:hypothetical protein [Chitinophagaceae bacterium]